MGNNYRSEQYLNKHFLTPKQLKLFNYIKEYKKENEYHRGKKAGGEVDYILVAVVIFIFFTIFYIIKVLCE